MTWNTFGHNHTKRILELQLGSGKLSHAYLFYGPEGVGKKTFSLEFSAKILGISAQQLGSHPDFSLLDQTSEISIEQMRKFLDTIGYKPFRAKKKIAVINNAHLMNTQSANALLKTLEEPSPSAILILISSGKNLLPTIVSRCQTFSYNEFTKSQLQEFARQNQLRADENILELSFGRIGRLRELQAGDYFRKEQAIIKSFEQIQRNYLAERLLAIGQFADDEPIDLQKKISSWMLWQAGTLSGNVRQYKSINALQQAYLQLQTNKNKKLILQSLFLKLHE